MLVGLFRSKIFFTIQALFNYCKTSKNVPIQFFAKVDPNQKLQFQMAVTLQMCIFDPPLVKPKCVLGVADFFQFSAVCFEFSTDCVQFPKKYVRQNIF